MTPSGKSAGRPTTAPIPAAINEAAGDWIARRDAGLSGLEEIQLREWVSTDPRHAAAFAELDAAWATMNFPRLSGRSDAILREVAAIEMRQARRRRRRYALISGGLAAAAALVFAFLTPSVSPPAGQAPSATVALRPDRRMLPDGSSIELNARADIAVEFSPTRRGVRLVRGEALFSVASDPARPFVVSAGGVEVRAVGTAFSVQLGASTVEVLVMEGKVTVATKAGTGPQSASAGVPHQPPIATSLSSETDVGAGERTIVSFHPQAAAPVMARVTAPEIERALAWRSHRVEFSATPLSEAVVYFNRQNRVQLSLADAATAGLRITGVLWTDDPEGFVWLLESSLGVTSSRLSDTAIVLRQ